MRRRIERAQHPAHRAVRLATGECRRRLGAGRGKHDERQAGIERDGAPGGRRPRSAPGRRIDAGLLQQPVEVAPSAGHRRGPHPAVWRSSSRSRRSPGRPRCSPAASARPARPGIRRPDLVSRSSGTSMFGVGRQQLIDEDALVGGHRVADRLLGQGEHRLLLRRRKLVARHPADHAALLSGRRSSLLSRARRQTCPAPCAAARRVRSASCVALTRSSATQMTW